MNPSANWTLDHAQMLEKHKEYPQTNFAFAKCSYSTKINEKQRTIDVQTWEDFFKSTKEQVWLIYFYFYFFYRIKEFTVDDLVNSNQEIVSYCHKFYTSIELVRQ